MIGNLDQLNILSKTDRDSLQSLHVIFYFYRGKTTFTLNDNCRFGFYVQN